MSGPAGFLRRARRWVLLVGVALALYGVARFDAVLLPAGASSPLYGVHAGDRLVIDRHSRTGSVGEAWLYRGSAGELLLGRVSPPPEGLDPAARAALAQGALWLCAEREIQGVADSRSLGPIPPAARVGRVLFVVPW